MNIDELISDLEKLRIKHGNLPVYYCSHREDNHYFAYEVGQADYEKKIDHPNYDDDATGIDDHQTSEGIWLG